MKRYIKGSLAMIMILGAAALAAGCAGEAEDTAVSEEAAVESSAASDHAMELLGGTLPEGEETLTLAGYGNAGAIADDDLSIADMMQYAIEDEYAARGEYEAIIQTFGVDNLYSNILASEENHIALLEQLYDAYGIKAPADESSSHVLIPDSLLEAARTGVQAEVLNIAMYEEFLSHELPGDVREVFEALKAASESHLKAFEKQVDRLS